MNRTWGNLELFQDAGDYEAFEKVLAEALDREKGMGLCAYCSMSRRAKRNWRPFAPPEIEAVRMEMTDGRKKWPNAWAWKARCVGRPKMPKIKEKGL
jgi:hypothetical protein